MLAFGPGCRRPGLENDPCACSFVLITSNGQVTIPLATPAIAPENEFTTPGDRFVAHLANKGEAVRALCFAIASFAGAGWTSGGP